MSKANKRARSGQRSHSVSDEYEIPIKDRKEFMGSNKSKWVDRKKYEKYLKWKGIK